MQSIIYVVYAPESRSIFEKKIYSSDANAIKENETTPKPYSIVKVDNYRPLYYDSGDMKIIFHSKEEVPSSSAIGSAGRDLDQIRRDLELARGGPDSARGDLELVGRGPDSAGGGGTRSKKHTPLEKTRKVRNNLFVKMEE